MIPKQVAARWTALGVALLVLLASLLLPTPAFYDWHFGDHYAYSEAGGVVQMVQRCNWIGAIHAQYLVGIDGLSLPLVILTTFIFTLAVVASWNQPSGVRGFLFLLLLLETTVLGTFVALDFFLFFVFLQVSLLPVVLLLGIWGGKDRGLAARKLMLTGLIGSIALLVAMVEIFQRSRGMKPGGTFDLIQLAQLLPLKSWGSMSGILFLLLVFAFLTRMPATPLHSWLGGTYTEIPMAAGVAVAGSMLCVGGYGLFRIAYPLFPQAAQSLWILMAAIGLLNIFYGALCAIAAQNLKRIVAYSAVSQMGFVVLGLALESWGSINGAMFMLISQSIAGAALFAGAAIAQDRAGSDELSSLGGLGANMPIFSGLSLTALLATMGLPGLCSFVGQVLVIFGAFQAGGPQSFSHVATRVIALLGCLSAVPTAAYLLRACQRMFFANPTPQANPPRDLDQRELAVLIPLTIMMILLGLLPWIFFFSVSNQTAYALLKAFNLGH